MLSPEDRDLIVRTVMGEANGEPFQGKVAVASVVKNRLTSGNYGDTVPGVLFAPKQFEPWNTRKRELLSFSPDDPRYLEASEAVDEAFAGNDPTNGATHFANVQTVKDRGNESALGWLRGMSNVSRYGNHTFGNADGKGSGGRAGISGGSVLGGMAGLDDDDGYDPLSEDEPFDLEGELGSLDDTDDPRRLAVRSLISQILDGLPPPEGQGHAVASPDDGAAVEDEEA